jgi:hypothetical protein
MARIRQFISGYREVKPPKTEVDAYVQTVADDDGNVYVYLYNYAAGGPTPGASPTQSVHFDRAAAREFRIVLERAFGSLDD